MANGYVVPTKLKGKKVIEYTVYPTGDKAFYVEGETPDRMNVKYAIDNVEEGGTVVLSRHQKDAEPNVVTEFNFGGDSKDNTIYLTKNVTIQGDESPTPEWNEPMGLSVGAAQEGWTAGVAENGGTTITGGRALFVIGVDPVPTLLKPVSVTIRNIRFKKFYRCAIRAAASKKQSEISGCSFVEYEEGQKGDPAGAFPIVVDSSGIQVLDNTGNPVINPATGKPEATEPAPGKLTGELRIAHNFLGAPPVGPRNNLVHVSNCDLDLEFSNNRITDMYWVGVAVYGNQGKTTISGNHITKDSSFYEGAAISVGTRPVFSPSSPYEGNEITIERNKVEVLSPNSHGILLFLLNGDYYEPKASNPASIRVQDNEVNMQGGGAFERAALSCLGACSKSKWRNNKVTGEACYGIWISDHAAGFVNVENRDRAKLNPSHNEFRDNNFEGFTATRSQVFIGATVDNLKLLNNKFGGVSHTSTNPHHPPLLDEVAEIRCKGQLGEIAENEFRNAVIRGWDTAPEYVGCIYLDKESKDNKVKYRDSQFPAAAVPPVANEIYDEGVSNKIVRLGP